MRMRRGLKYRSLLKSKKKKIQSLMKLGVSCLLALLLSLPIFLLLPQHQEKLMTASQRTCRWSQKTKMDISTICHRNWMFPKRRAR